jgi:hypothetical protein
MNMKKDPQKIVEQINILVSELAALAGVPKSNIVAKSPTQVKDSSVKRKKSTSGATGCIRLLVEDGKLDSPRQLPEIIEFLRQEGRHYAPQSISMGLLNLVRERVLVRLRDKGTKSWKYAVRR